MFGNVVQNIKDAERVAEKLHENLVSDMDFDQVLQEFAADAERLDYEALYYYMRHPEDYPEMDAKRYERLVIGINFVRVGIQKYLAGESNATDTLHGVYALGPFEEPFTHRLLKEIHTLSKESKTKNKQLEALADYIRREEDREAWREEERRRRRGG